MKTICALYGRDEETNLPTTFKNLLNQGFDDIIYVDDCSNDDSVKIAKDFNIKTIELKIRHKSYVGQALLSKTVNHCINAIYSIPNVDYFMITASDIVLSDNYTKNIIQRMEQDKKLAICSGVIIGEYTVYSSPRGAGRIYRFNFWDKYIKRFPLSYTWESYPVYKALSLDLKTTSFRDIKMKTLRPTKEYKSYYGYAMRELGWSHIYSLAQCLTAILFKNKNIGMSMLKSYLFCDLPVIDKDVSKWIKAYQIRTIIKSVFNLRKYL